MFVAWQEKKKAVIDVSLVDWEYVEPKRASNLGVRS